MAITGVLYLPLEMSWCVCIQSEVLQTTRPRLVRTTLYLDHCLTWPHWPWARLDELVPCPPPLTEHVWMAGSHGEPIWGQIPPEWNKEARFSPEVKTLAGLSQEVLRMPDKHPSLQH